jgi:hypothetical protein
MSYTTRVMLIRTGSDNRYTIEPIGIILIDVEKAARNDHIAKTKRHVLDDQSVVIPPSQWKQDGWENCTSTGYAWAMRFGSCVVFEQIEACRFRGMLEQEAAWLRLGLLLGLTSYELLQGGHFP